MFAVPGWSVSSSQLRTQTLETDSAPKKDNNASTPDQSSEATPNAGKKRKRSGGKSKINTVNASNVADLWETVIEGKEKPKDKEPAEKRQRISDGGAEGKGEGDEGVGAAPKPRIKKKTLKEKRREKKLALSQATEPGQGEPEASKVEKTAGQGKAPSVTKPTPQLTPLQASMRQKLISARFRHLNQTLYTTPSAHSLSLFEQNPEMFTEYHEGFRRQVEVWPENPVDGYIRIIKARGKIRGPPRQKAGSEASTEVATIPLPRTEGTCHIADLGCGDAALSASLQKDSKKLHLKLHSFDLYSPSRLVTRADISDLPLSDGSIDIAVFCLALMGTNWIDFIEEAFRVLRWKGELWVAEIKSRFGRVGNKGRVEHSVGNRQKKAVVPSKKDRRKREDEEAIQDDAALVVEVDGNEDAKQETDVSAFVEVLRKRGFMLKGVDSNGEGAIDLSNKMFVRMQFVKGLTPIKGKCVPEPKGMADAGVETWKRKPKAKFIDTEEETPVSSEAAVLKPCVYKLR
ncbi:uncharacterized protein BP5553_03181 [Venustampulla echinocandica]|uniref:Ribosomal RNA-processing protein 8 n=1 Tax=Venustampulla echinocandica TaxID=2656787 RepID=A0A370TTJ2_9HELO|nr:uncharacterized protein BP5553_03181 [Venustampulla echinocandica]RDL38841.1 hypothetical protein BP5553_03181 [Venustampulla echinocandica]